MFQRKYLKLYLLSVSKCELLLNVIGSTERHRDRAGDARVEDRGGRVRLQFYLKVGETILMTALVRILPFSL